MVRKKRVPEFSVFPIYTIFLFGGVDIKVLLVVYRWRCMYCNHVHGRVQKTRAVAREERALLNACSVVHGKFFSKKNEEKNIPTK